ncbi:MAG TPA: nucleotide sugar dehydrogenase, partial [Gammaproteobacteria bacterium]|nr:nucleotide sugar dehydrogenase [Gammaproteobacteria bacterium]
MAYFVVMGLGYVGLLLAREAVKVGISVIGVDTNPQVVNTLNAGQSHVCDVSDADLAEMIAAGFVAVTDRGALQGAEVVALCVPTPLDDTGTPDLTAVCRASQTVVPHLRRDMLVTLESTIYPGATDEVVRPILEMSGLSAGVDFYLAFSPERTDPGNRVFGLRNTPKIVGGHTQRCAKAAATFYCKLCDQVVLAKGTREAEMAKLLENTYRAVNIALVNELSTVCRR